MKAISIRQPWAWLILHAGKDIENRDWATKYRGPVLIHASKTMTEEDYREGVAMCAAACLDAVMLPPPVELPRGGLVGRVDIVGCATRSTSRWFVGDYGFVLANAKPIPFIPYRGQLSLFDVPDDIALQVAP